jgi:3-methyladenine DNA glycosylase/8-oxoguanine DNA glycosylase
MEADAAHAALTGLHGVGPWTADIYLLFCLGHADAWPAGDLALQEAARLAFKLKRRPASKDMIMLASHGVHGAAWRRISCGAITAASNAAIRCRFKQAAMERAMPVA